MNKRRKRKKPVSKTSVARWTEITVNMNALLDPPDFVVDAHPAPEAFDEIADYRNRISGVIAVLNAAGGQTMQKYTAKLGRKAPFKLEVTTSGQARVRMLAEWHQRMGGLIVVNHRKIEDSDTMHDLIGSDANPIKYLHKRHIMTVWNPSIDPKNFDASYWGNTDWDSMPAIDSRTFIRFVAEVAKLVIAMPRANQEDWEFIDLLGDPVWKKGLEKANPELSNHVMMLTGEDEESDKISTIL